ncbi:NAD(P)H-dependent oxidoreductase [Aggregicoccus sp. 17bor-14]|uniref:NADPH-dependent FMN reductase n=1 Tax=Myxococcaceae TaxID=31 RepID=UPI00129CAAF1|nr:MULTISPECIES: NAD(P)H-dependent oxidoreductase [Myxococcaceae]MBF5043089.1 NAD(P)H-dependent oxidoreductase [Simulacricoccus sp. 17bor-14]MRI88852.1 NAD(P)H-dependent oxidoreductase [Aggregicoccus sp. 17bor-14]
MRVLAFAASLRQASLNHRLVELAARIAREAGAEVDLARFREFDMPLYDGDLNEAHGLPAGALLLKRRIEAADALLIASPEYNYSISGLLKNAIDWVSRARPMPWRGRSVYLLAASPGRIGGIRGLWQTRIPLEGCGSLVFPDMFALAEASAAFTEGGDLKEPALAERLRKELGGFLRLAEAVACITGSATAPKDQERRARIQEALEEESKIQPKRG